MVWRTGIITAVMWQATNSTKSQIIFQMNRKKKISVYPNYMRHSIECEIVFWLIPPFLWWTTEEEKKINDEMTHCSIQRIHSSYYECVACFSYQIIWLRRRFWNIITMWGSSLSSVWPTRKQTQKPFFCLFVSLSVVIIGLEIASDFWILVYMLHSLKCLSENLWASRSNKFSLIEEYLFVGTTRLFAIAC